VLAAVVTLMASLTVDNVLDPAAVADPAFGCAFTTPQRPGLPPCG
jgi:hypothetical protein